MRKKLYLLTTNYGIWYGKMDKYEEMLEEINKKNTNNEIYKLNVQIFEKNNELIRNNEEIERLNNIIDTLESYLEQQYLEWKDCETDVRFMAQEDKVILDRLKELKEGK